MKKKNKINLELEKLFDEYKKNTEKSSDDLQDKIKTPCWWLYETDNQKTKAKTDANINADIDVVSGTDIIDDADSQNNYRKQTIEKIRANRRKVCDTLYLDEGNYDELNSENWYCKKSDIQDKYNSRGIKIWNQSPKTLKIGSKYLNIDYQFRKHLYRCDIPTVVSSTIIDYIAEPKSHERTFLEEFMYGFPFENFFKTEYIFDPDTYSTRGFSAGTAYQLYNEDVFYDFWTEVTGTEDNIYVKAACGECEIKKGSKEDYIRWYMCSFICEYIEYSAISGEFYSHRDDLYNILNYLLVTEPFSSEKKRAEIYRAGVKFYLEQSVEAAKEVYKYINSLNCHVLKYCHNGRATEDVLERMPKEIVDAVKNAKTPKEMFEEMRSDMDNAELEEAFYEQVIKPYYTREDAISMVKHYRKHDYDGAYYMNYLSSNYKKHWDNQHDAKKMIALIDAEDPLVKYEFSRGFQEMVLDAGYDGIGGIKKYPKKLHGLGFDKITDEEKYMMGNYADMNHIMDIVIEANKSIK